MIHIGCGAGGSASMDVAPTSSLGRRQTSLRTRSEGTPVVGMPRRPGARAGAPCSRRCSRDWEEGHPTPVCRAVRVTARLLDVEARGLDGLDNRRSLDLFAGTGSAKSSNPPAIEPTDRELDRWRVGALGRAVRLDRAGGDRVGGNALTRFHARPSLTSRVGGYTANEGPPGNFAPAAEFGYLPWR